jgi:hypothetical protein
MQYFDNKWIRGELTEQEYKIRKEHYFSDIQKICREVDLITRLVIENINLHDGILFEIVIDNNIASISFLFGDNDTGYYKAYLQFENALCAAPFCIKEPIIILYDEYTQLDSGLCRLSLINSLEQEMCIDFKSISISLSKSNSHEYLSMLKK